MAQNNSKKIIFILTGKFILMCIFIYAAYSKILDPEGFIKSIKAYEIVPEFLLNPFGHSLPFLEFIASILLWIPRWEKVSLLTMGLMLIAFIIALSYAILTEKNIDCGCFNNNQPAGPLQLIIDLILFLDIIMIYILTLKKETNSSINGV